MNWFNNNFAYRPNTATANTTTPGSNTIGLGPGSIGLGPGAYGPIGTGTGTTGTGTTGTGSNNGSTTSNNTGWWGNGTGWGNNGSIQVNPDALGFGFWNGSTGSNPSIPSRPCPPWLTGTGLGSNNGNTSWGFNNVNTSWGYGTGGQGNNPYIQYRPDLGALGFGFNNGNTGSAGYLPFCGFNNGSTGSARNNCGVPVGCGFNNGNTGWGNRSYESGRYYNYANERQPYDDFLIRGFNPGYEQCAVAGTRNRRRGAEQTIDSIGQVGFWGRGSGYPQNLYYPQNSYNV